jgi:DNA repair photolyase
MMTSLFDTNVDLERGLALAARVHPKYASAFEGLSARHRAAVALYFLPHRSAKDALEVTRPRVIKWYCPFADQRVFPSGHRYCINVYTGCEHECEYCYAAGYTSRHAGCKHTFRADLVKDLDALEAYDVPPAPVHMSNSTDPLQPLEQEHRHTLYALEKLAERRHRFTTITLLTKNPAVLTDDRYLRALHQLNGLPAGHPRAAWFAEKGYPPLRIECSLAFYNEESRSLFDRAAPSVESRMDAIRFLRNEGLPVFLRIDPLFPHDPLADGRSMSDFGLPDIQPLTDLTHLIQFARDIGTGPLVYSVAKITRPKIGTLPPPMDKMRRVYQCFAGQQPLVFRGGSWRLPTDVARRFVVEPFLGLCGEYSMEAKMCKANLTSTP